MTDRTIDFGVNEPGVYDGVLYWVDTNGVAFHRFQHPEMQAKAQPYIDAFNLAAARSKLGSDVPRETSESP